MLKPVCSDLVETGSFLEASVLKPVCSETKVKRLEKEV